MLKLNPKKEKKEWFSFNIPQKTLLALIISAAIILFYRSYKQETEEYDQLREKGIYTIGLVQKVARYHSRNTSKEKIYYKFYHKGDWIEAENTLDEREPIKGAFYAVKYVPDDLTISKIIITSRPITRTVAFKSYTKMFGEIESINPTYPNYVRLHVKYAFKGENYKVETILHKDSLPCGTLEECKESKRIKLFVSNNFPFFTDLYYKSSNRQHLQ